MPTPGGPDAQPALEPAEVHGHRTSHRLLGHDVALHRAGTHGPVVVLVHGIGVSHRYFRPLIRVLAPTCRVLAPDLPGFGRSGRAVRALTIEEHARVVAALVDEVVGGEPVVLVGHSLGAQVVAEVARTRPDLVGRAVLVGPVADPRARSVARQGWRLLRDTFREPLAANVVVLTDYLRCGPRHYFATLPSMVDYPLEEVLPTLTVPVLVVRGERDPIAPADFVRRLVGRVPGAVAAEVPGAAHVAMYRPHGLAAVCGLPAAGEPVVGPARRGPAPGGG